MIFMPGIVCQGDKRLTWAKYAVNYTEKAGTSSNFSPNYARTKKAASAYTIQNGVFVLTNSATKTAENIAVGDYLVNVSTSNNSATNGSTLYKVTRHSGRPWTTSSRVMNVNYADGTGVYGTKIYSQNPDTGELTLSGTYTYDTVRSNMGAKYSSISDFTKMGTTGTFEKVYVLYSGSNMHEHNPYKSDTVTITYTPYTLSGAKGAYIGEVKANEGTYPENGIKDGFWYVLLN